MSAQLFLVLMEALGLFLAVMLGLLNRSSWRKQPPFEVEDVYTRERHEEFVNYSTETLRANCAHRAIRFAIFAALVLLLPFGAIESFAGYNPYATSLLTLLIFSAANACESYRYEYQVTLGIRQRYGLNHLSRRGFVGTYLRQRTLSLAGMVAIVLLACLVGHNLTRVTNNFTQGFMPAFLICLVLCGVLELVLMAQQLFTYYLLRREYTFQPLPEGKLRQQIARMLDGCKHRVSQVYVYDESTRSNAKNAFLLRVLWHREIGIADNFIEQNSERELLAVLSHEIGHLKHQHGLPELVNALFVLALAFVGALLSCNPWIMRALAQWVRSSFGITYNNYFLLLLIVSAFAYIPSIFVGIATNARSREREREADLEVVRNGYGEDLIATLKRMAADQLVNVSPHPFVEFAEYDHPSLINRIRNIRQAEAELAQRIVSQMDFSDAGDSSSVVPEFALASQHDLDGSHDGGGNADLNS